MEYWLTTNPWPGVILWIILYISDYYLTIYSARGFRDIGNIQFEGSFELTPLYQKDIDHLRLISKLHITVLVLTSLLIFLIWWMTKLLFPFPWSYLAYLLYLGMFLLMEVAIHLRHLRNISLIREYRKSGGIEGKIFYRRWFTYRVSASELYTLSILFLMIAILTYSPFFLGGAFACWGTGFKHSRLARKVKSSPVQPVEVRS